MFKSRLDDLSFAMPGTKLRPVLANCRVFLDFDNTMTQSDVLDDIIKTFSINDNWKKLEQAWVEGRIGTKACLRGQMKDVRVTKKKLFRYLADIDLDPYCYKTLTFLKSEGVSPVVLSDNFTPIVKEILRRYNLQDVKVYGNSLRFYLDRLIPSFPYDNPFCPTCAHCKKIHLTKGRGEQKLIVYVGDGRSDFCPAEISDIVFAKGQLADHMKQCGKDCIPFNDLSTVYQHFKEAVHVVSYPSV